MGAHLHVRDFDISAVFVTIYEPQSVESLCCALQEQTRFVSCFVALQGPVRLLLTAAVGWLGFRARRTFGDRLRAESSVT